KYSSSIQNIAREIQLLAVNAGVEAARHGVAGRGFAVIAEAVKTLADQTRNATDQTQKHLGSLSTAIEHLQSKGSANLAAAQRVENETGQLTDGFAKVANMQGAIAAFVRELEVAIAPLQEQAQNSAQLLSGVTSCTAQMEPAIGALLATEEHFGAIVGLTQELNGLILDTEQELPISSLVARCKATANRIGELFEEAVKQGAIHVDQLFDENYRPVPGVTPQQFLNGFTSFTDKVLPALQEPLLAADARITFCAAVDRNGYLPTHNRKFSQPPSDDPVWNGVHARNRRIFDDGTGLASARNRKPVLLQAYRRDMGDGHFAIMHELASPIMVNGRHWGGFRIGFKA
ncbi:MAG: methyl-accepting chemotaxis protein, partial [Bosea sp. (in: a-proteobacteria)]